MDFFIKALNLQPNNAQAHLNLSNVYFNIGDLQKGEYHKLQATSLSQSNK